MQRIEVKFTEEECVAMERWIKEECTIIKEIEREISFINEGEEEKVFLNLSEWFLGGVLLKIKSSKGYLINDSLGIYTEIIFYKMSSLMGVFSLFEKCLKEEILIKFTEEYEENGDYKSYKKRKQSELNTIKCFVLKKSTLNVFNIIKYFDFGNKEDLSIAVFSYINYMYSYGKASEVEEFIRNKLEILGYERNPKLKDKLPIYEKKDRFNLESVSPKSLNYAFENFLEVFYKLISGNIKRKRFISGDIEENMSSIVEYSCGLVEYYINNSCEPCT